MTKRAIKPVVYFVFRNNAGETSTRFGGFAKRLLRLGDMPEAEYRTVALEDLTFVIGTEHQAAIYNVDGSQVFHDAAFVYFKSWEGMPEEAAMIVAYLQSKGIPFEDQAVRHAGTDKASQTWKLWAAGVPVIPSIISSERPSKQIVEVTLGKAPYLLKPVHGEKGRGIQVAKTYAAIPADTRHVIVQPFIANRGDFRVLTYGYTVRGALLRVAQAGAIVNNTSQGATSEYVERHDLDAKLVDLAERAARIVEYAIAGVDILPDQDGNYYVLEVNQGSQIVTGHHVFEKIAAFSEYMRERHTDRYARKKQPSKLQPIGRHVIISLPEAGVKNIRAKVDTGAYRSVVHATGIREYRDETGVPTLEYSVLVDHEGVHDVPSSVQRTQEFTKAVIKNSFGHRQTRYVVMMKISLDGRIMRTGVTLTDRSDMAIPILLGRRFLRGRFVVNVELARPKSDKGVV